MTRRKQKVPRSFEQAVEELEQIVAEIERGETGFEESLVRYARANFLLEYCRETLQDAERRIERLSGES